MSVNDSAQKLKQELENSEEYQNYLELRKKVMEKEGSKKMLRDYQNLMMKMQNKRMSGEELGEEEKEKLQNLQNFIKINDNVKKYLEAEYEVSKMLNEIQRIVFSDIDVGIPNEDTEENNSDTKNS